MRVLEKRGWKGFYGERGSRTTQQIWSNFLIHRNVRGRIGWLDLLDVDRFNGFNFDPKELSSDWHRFFKQSFKWDLFWLRWWLFEKVFFSYQDCFLFSRFRLSPTCFEHTVSPTALIDDDSLSSNKWLFFAIYHIYIVASHCATSPSLHPFPVSRQVNSAAKHWSFLQFAATFPRQHYKLLF